MYTLHGSNWVRLDDGTRVSARKVSDYLALHQPGRAWSWKSFAIGLLVGFLALAIIVWVLQVVGWAVGVVVGALELLIGLAILALVLGLIIWGAAWLFRKINNQDGDGPFGRRFLAYGRTKQPATDTHNQVSSDSDQTQETFWEDLRQRLASSWWTPRRR